MEEDHAGHFLAIDHRPTTSEDLLILIVTIPGKLDHRFAIPLAEAAIHFTVNASELEANLKVKLRKEIEVYRQAFIDFAQDILTRNDIKEGKGPFRDSAHRIEDVLKAHYVPDLEENILQLRR